MLLLALLPGITVSGFYSAPVSADAGPDLIVQNITLSPAEPAIDDTVTITVTVKNQGTTAAGPSYVVCNVDSTILATFPVNQLEAGTMATATFTWKAEPGSHTIKAVADSSNSVAETNETNNTKTYTLTTLAVDLIIQSITWSPASPSRGDTVTISVVIKNQGSAGSHTTNVNLYIDGSSRGFQDVAAINPGGTVTKTYVWTALSGQHAIKAAVDESNSIRESNDANNDKTADFLTSPPDLMIDKIAWSPLNPSKNDTVSFNVTVKNQGIGRSDATNLAYYIDGELKSTLPVSALEPGISTNVTFSCKVISEKHVIKAVIDYFQNVIESDETNNEKTVTIQSLGPDLTVTRITWLPANAAVGDSVTFTATIRNQGAGRSEKGRAAFYLDGALVSSPDIPEIEANAETTLSYLWLATGGSHAISVHADYDNTLVEISEENNKFSTTISIIAPDLIIPSITWSPAGFAIDDIVTFSVTIKNQGGGRADSFYIIYYMDEVQLATDFIVRVDSGASVNSTCTWKALNGRHTFKAMADYNKHVTEDNENNNEHSVTVAPNMPDLAVDTVTWSPADIRAGSDVTFDIVIKNLGTLNAGPSRIAYYIDGAVTGFTDIGQLDAGAAVTVPFIWSATAGLHTISIVADSANKIFEIDEANNTKTVSVPPPDLIVQGITWTPAGASTGDKVTFTATIKNQGNSRTQSSQMTCYVDGVAIATIDVPEIDAAGSVTRTFDWTAAAGKHKIRVTADANNRVTEVDETNNTRETDFATLTADLAIKEIGWLMENPLSDNKVIFTISVKNQGTGNAGASNITYTVDKLPAVTVGIAAIPAANTASLTFSLTLEPGRHTVIATADSGAKIDELDETNNSAALSFSTIVPDLIVKTITLTPAAAIAGDNVTITLKVENRGREKALNTELSLSVDGSAAGSAVIKEIDIGAIISQDFYWKAAAGSHEINAYADIGNLILESNETNNARSRTITIEKPAAAAAPKPANLSKASTADKGFISSYWWVLLLIAAGLGGAAFASALRSFRKG